MFIIYRVLDTIVDFLATTLGKPGDQIKLVLCLLLNMPLGLLMNTYVP